MNNSKARLSGQVLESATRSVPLVWLVTRPPLFVQGAASPENVERGNYGILGGN